jgi:hypothetical protein
MAMVGRLLEAQGFASASSPSPTGESPSAFARPGPARTCSSASPPATWTRWSTATPATALRSDDAYTPGGEGGRRPDRSVIVYASARARPSRRADRDRRHRGQPAPHRALRLLVREGAPLDPARRQGRPAGLRQRRAPGRRDRAPPRRPEPIASITDLRGTGLRAPDLARGLVEIDSTDLDTPGPLEPAESIPTRWTGGRTPAPAPPGASPRAPGHAAPSPGRRSRRRPRPQRDPPALLRAGRDDPVLYAHASRVLHLEANPGNARALVQRHGDQDVWLNPPPIPLTTAEMDASTSCPTSGVPHPATAAPRSRPTR